MGGNNTTTPRSFQYFLSVRQDTIYGKDIANTHSHLDPFYIKEEFAPSDRKALAKRQQAAHNMVTPHMRLLQFLASHYNATRLSSRHTEKAFLRLVDATLEGLRHSTGHPLAREIRFHVVNFGLLVLKHTVALDFDAKCHLKNQILSAALSWFSFPPRWSFGGNRLQLKAEVRLLQEVRHGAKNIVISSDKSTSKLKELQLKVDLLDLLLDSELAKLMVWLYPLDEPRKSHTAMPMSKAAIEVSTLREFQDLVRLIVTGISSQSRAGRMERKSSFGYPAGG